MSINYRKILKVVLPLVIALISVFGVARVAASSEFHEETIAALDEKKETVMELAAASTATSAAITLIPGDTATPIAEKLADFSSYFLVVLCAIYLEKYLVTITGYAAFKVLIPIGCILYAISVFVKEDMCKRLANKLILFGLAIVLVIPASVKVSDLIESSYQSSIENTLETAKQTAEEVEKEAESEEEKSGFLDSLTSTVTEIGTKVETSINNFIEALAVLIVTSCVIPIVVMMFFVWLVKSVLAIDIPTPSISSLGKKPMDMLRMK